jgi:hypothetical protein
MLLILFNEICLTEDTIKAICLFVNPVLPIAELWDSYTLKLNLQCFHVHIAH